ncbi:MAG: hypothetical protein EOO52_04225 [Gammaproteobacteria bacterium]|nr:MAG: hypothetical protein EOO52_04225 [Gammaproteobacteria bacterium]
MSDQRMDVFLLATPQDGVERSTMVTNLARVFKKDFQAIEKMLRRPRTLVKADVGQELAAKYRTIIEKAGGQCELVVQGQSAAVAKKSSRVEAATNSQPLTPVASEPVNSEAASVSYCVQCNTAIRFGQVRCARCSIAEYSEEKTGLSLEIVAYAIAFLIIFVLMILIAIPAYKDYTTRAKIQSAMPMVINAHKSVGSFIKKTRSYPNENILVGLPDKINSPVIESIKLRDEAFIEVAYRFPHLKGKNTILWTPIDTNSGITWSCKGGTLDDRYRQKECWMGSENSNTADALTKNFLSNDKKMSIGVPASWKVKNLMPNTILGFANEQDQTYIAILGDSKTDLMEETRLEDYVSIVQQQMAMNVANGELVRENRKIIIKKLPAERFIYRGDVGGVKMTYVVTLFEANDRFYRMLAWTPQSRFDKNKALLESVSRSIRLQ